MHMPTPSPSAGTIGFNAGKARKRAARMLAAKLDFDDLTGLLNFLLDEKIKAELPGEYREILAEDNSSAVAAQEIEHRKKSSAGNKKAA